MTCTVDARSTAVEVTRDMTRDVTRDVVRDVIADGEWRRDRLAGWAAASDGRDGRLGRATAAVEGAGSK